MNLKFSFLPILLITLLTGCGSGTSETDTAQSQNGESNQQPSDINEQVDEVESGVTEPGSDSDTSSDENTDPVEGVDEQEDVDSPETGEIFEPVASGGRRIETLFAQGMPAPGFPDEQIAFDTDELVFSNTGQIAIRASVSGDPVIYVGDSAGLRPLIRRGDSLEGVSNTVRFGDASELQWSSDDRLGFAVSLIGTETRTGYAIAQGSTVEVVVVPGVSQVTDAQGVVRTVTDVKRSLTALTPRGTSISSAGVALQVSADGRLLAILPNNGELQFVTRLYSLAEVELEERLDNGCPFSIGEFSNETIRYYDDGSLVFEAIEKTERGRLEQCTSGTTLIRYANGVFSTIVGSGDAMPGPIDESFSFITLIEDVPTERTIFTSGVRSDFSIWDVEFPDAADLIAVDGEMVQLATRSGPIDLETVSQLDVLGDRVAMVVEASNSVALLAGTRGEGQPHASFEEPGFNVLAVIVSGDGLIPEGFSSTGFWSELRRPTIASAGTLYFTGQISDAIDGSLINESMWKSDFNGELSQVLSIGDEVVVEEGVIEPISVGSFSSPGIDLLQNVVTTPAGGLILMVNTNNRPSNILGNRSVLIHLPLE